MSDLVGNPEDRFSYNEAHIMLGTSVLTVTATDVDSNSITYSILPSKYTM